MIDLGDSDVSFDLGQNFDTSASMLDGMGDQEFESSPLRARDEMIHTPPSDRTLALGQSKLTKAITEPKIDISDDLMGSVNFDADLDNLDEAFKDVSLHTPLMVKLMTGNRTQDPSEAQNAKDGR